jgi:uncharacterized protein (DUF1499 family)
MIDFATLEKRREPSRWLVAPPGLLQAAEPDAAAPVFDAAPARVIQVLAEVLEARPRTAITERADDNTALEAVEISRIFRFKDPISARAVATDDGRTALALYSRSTVGYWDMGVNRKRVEALVEAVRSGVS